VASHVNPLGHDPDDPVEQVIEQSSPPWPLAHVPESQLLPVVHVSPNPAKPEPADENGMTMQRFWKHSRSLCVQSESSIQ
jgi:hypothetical protein